jgi:integral membrane sensor domain MASE1
MFEIVRRQASASRLQWCRCAVRTLSFILTLAASCHVNWPLTYMGLSEHVFSAFGNFLQIEK